MQKIGLTNVDTTAFLNGGNEKWQELQDKS